jgi:hypothetical protein
MGATHRAYPRRRTSTTVIEMTLKRSLAVCAAILLFAASAPIAAQSVPCRSLADAILKHETVPYHA